DVRAKHSPIKFLRSSIGGRRMLRPNTGRTAEHMNLETLAIHAGQDIDPATGAVIPPIYLSTTFERAADGSFPHGHIYTRSSNPNRGMLEQCLAALEGGADCAAFGSGLAAAMSVFQALQPGDHVLVPDDAYHGVSRLVREIMVPWG